MPRGRRSEVGDQRSEIRDQRSEVRDQRSEVGDQRSEIRGQRSDTRDRKKAGTLGGRDATKLEKSSRVLALSKCLADKVRGENEKDPPEVSGPSQPSCPCFGRHIAFPVAFRIHTTVASDAVEHSGNPVSQTAVDAGQR